ncbi:uncharacterized protein METZ01_LOCUS393999 [marine metagenome]|uniref:DUF115 domain-containing protein n=1 Tax=marine metagenome TaxID=408172 RepID=A0A382V543_9ZZZZ
MLYLIGNGPSRKSVDLDNWLSTDEWWGFNGIYTEGYQPDLLFAMDIPVQRSVFDDEYYKKGKVAVGNWEPMEIELWDALKLGCDTDKMFEIRKDGDTHFIAQGFQDYMTFIAYNSIHQNNIIMYEFPKLKNLFGGMSALGYAAEKGYRDICLIGFDALIDSDPSNIYEGSGLFYYLDKYTEESRRHIVNTQQAQFKALLKEYININVFYFKNPLVGLEKIEYNSLSYENSEEWILGQGLESEYNA